MARIRIPSQFFFGIAIIAIGVLFTLGNLDLLYVEDYLRYWPVFLIIFGVARLIEPGTDKIWATVIGGLGILFLLDNLDMIRFRIFDWWPLLLVAAGASILWGSSRKSIGSQPVVLHGSEGADSDSVVDLTAIMGGIERKNDSKDFRGGKITAVMGGIEFDLRNADMRESPAVIEVFAMWGGIEIRVPQQWSVTMEGTPMLGGLSDSTSHPIDGNTKRLILRGTALMGGVEVKN